MDLALLIPDTHRPWHHKKAYSLMLRAAASLPIKAVYLLGDYADFFAVTSHLKDPRLPQMLEKEVDDVNAGLDELSATFKGAKFYYIEGNHEYRLARYLQERAPALFGMVDCPGLFNIAARPKWTWVPYGPNQKMQILNSKLWARHEPLGASAKATATNAGASLVFGHTHRIEEGHKVSISGSNHVAFSVGWLGDKRKDLVFGYVKKHHEWQLGFGLVYVDPLTRYFYHQKIQILDNMTCSIGGRVFK